MTEETLKPVAYTTQIGLDQINDNGISTIGPQGTYKHEIPLVLLSDAKSVIEEKTQRIAELERLLFPYANNKEISGISFDNKYLIGDKDSIKFFHEMMNRGLQIDVYAKAYEQRIAAANQEISRLQSMPKD